MTNAAEPSADPAVQSLSDEVPGRGDSQREALELIARNLSDLRKNMAKLNDEPLAMLVHRAWQRAASHLLKLPPADQPSGFDRPKLT